MGRNRKERRKLERDRLKKMPPRTREKEERLQRLDAQAGERRGYLGLLEHATVETTTLLELVRADNEDGENDDFIAHFEERLEDLGERRISAQSALVDFLNEMVDTVDDDSVVEVATDAEVIQIAKS